MTTDTTTVLVTLGHDGLTMPAQVARRAVRSCLSTHGATFLGVFRNGEGTWAGNHETCDAFLCALPTRNLPHVRACLAHLARKAGQDSLGFLVHGAAAGSEPSYVSAEPCPACEGSGFSDDGTGGVEDCTLCKPTYYTP